jgi:hypothetical protein
LANEEGPFGSGGAGIRLILIFAFAVLSPVSCRWFRPDRKADYLALTEVIPQARIISEEDGIIEYQGTQYLLGRKDLSRKKRLIDSLDLLNPAENAEVDLRFAGQVIIRKRKEAGD